MALKLLTSRRTEPFDGSVSREPGRSKSNRCIKVINWSTGAKLLRSKAAFSTMISTKPDANTPNSAEDTSAETVAGLTTSTIAPTRNTAELMRLTRQ